MQGENGPIDPLRFVGSRNKPLLPKEIAQMRPELGSGERPQDLEDLALRRSIYIHSDSEDEPQVEVSRVELESGVWRVDIPAERAEAGAIHGQSGLLRKPEEFLAEIDSSVDFRGYRPEWADFLPEPRLLPRTEFPLMPRLGRRGLVRPFQTTRFPPEERQVYRDASWPWGLVAKIFSNDMPGGAGSAVLVGPRLAVTASHCVPRGNPWWIRVVPAYFDGSSLHGSGVESFVSDWAAFDTGGEVCGYDWALLRLYEPLGSWLGYFGYNGYDDDWEDQAYWMTLGYPSAIDNQKPSRQFWSAVFDDDSDSNGGQELETRADLSPGNSGGPMFGWWDEGRDPRVIGVVSGEEYDWELFGGEWGNVVAGGSGFTNLIAWGRTNWP